MSAISKIMAKINRTDLKMAVIVSVLTVAALAPFINKPFNVDDVFYLKMAEQIVRNPLEPYSFYINWSGITQRVWESKETTFPPFVPYCIAGIIALFGESERALHLFFLIFPVTAAVSMYFISKKFTKTPVMPPIIMICTPVFLVSSTSIMVDTCLLALILLSTALFMHGVDNGKKAFVVSANILGSMAFLTKYLGIIVFLLFGIYILFSGKYGYLKYFAIPFAIFAIWCLHNYVIYHGLHFFVISKQMGQGLSLNKAVSILTFFSGCLFFPLFSLFLVKRKEVPYLLLLFIAGFMIGYVILLKYAPAGMFAFLSIASIFFVYRIALGYKDLNKFVLLWFLAALYMNIVTVPWIAARYLIITVPPAVILFASMIERWKIRNIAIVCAASLACSISLAISDYQWAKTYVSIAQYVQKKNYPTCVFWGHFGFQYYMEKAGVKSIDEKDLPKYRGVVVYSKLSTPWKLDNNIRMPKTRILEMIKYDSRLPVRLMNLHSAAGFYSSFWGIFPYSISTAPLEEFAIFEI